MDPSGVAHPLLGGEAQIGNDQLRCQGIGTKHQTEHQQSRGAQHQHHTAQQHQHRKGIARNRDHRTDHGRGDLVQDPVEALGKIGGAVMREELIVLQHQIPVDLVDQVVPDLGAEHALQKCHAKAQAGGEPERHDQQPQQPAGLIEHAPTKDVDAGDLIRQFHAGHQADQPRQQTHQQDVHQALQERGHQHHHQKTKPAGWQLLQQAPQISPGLASQGHGSDRADATPACF